MQPWDLYYLVMMILRDGQIISNITFSPFTVSSASAEKGLMEVAFEVGCALQVQRGMFQPSESPATILESLLKMHAK